MVASEQNFTVEIGSPVTEIEQILAEQLQIYQQLYAIAEQKKRILIENKLEALEQLIQAEELLVIKAGKCEAEGSALQAKIARELGLDAETLTLAQLGEALGPTAASVLQTGEQLLQIVTDLNGLNEQNSSLIEHSLKYLHYKLQLLTQIGNDGTMYGQKGAEAPASGSAPARIFDRKA